MLGAELLLKCLEDNGVKIVFGIPGGAVIPLYDALNKSNLKHILTGHEQGAAHAADGFARSSGEVGVCFATSGPGATNLITGLATAHMDSSPVVAITGQVASSFLGKDSFQEADMIGLSQSVTKHSYMLQDAKDIPQVVEEAFYIARNGRPGPVLIDVPKDVFTQEVSEFPQSRIRPNIVKKQARPELPIEDADKALEVIKKAKRPLILAGGGLNNSTGSHLLLKKFALDNEIPVAVTLMGKGVFQADSPLFLGMVGMHGTTQANWAIQNCDCLLALGVRFDDRVTSKLEGFAPKAKIIHVDIDAAELNKNCAVTYPICGDCGDFLKHISKKIWAIKNNKEWLNQINLKTINNSKLKVADGHPQLIMEKINDFLDEETIIVTDVGQHQMWAALFVHPHQPRSFITSGGLGTMGFGLPAAIGVQLANPEKKVILITGDGSLQMNIQELAVIKKLKLPIKICIINNGFLGMVRQWQELFFNENYAETGLDQGPDWVKLAAAYGIKGATLWQPTEQIDTLSSNLTGGEPCLLDIKVDPGANVFPMVPAGSTLDHMWGSWENETHTGSLG